MNIDILHGGAFQSALVTFSQGESIVSDSGAMFRASSNVDIDIQARAKGSSGIFGAAKRMFGGDTFFQSTYTLTSGESGEVGLAATLPGEVEIIDLAGKCWLTTGGSFLAACGDVSMEARFQGLKGFFSGESLFFLEVQGSGQVIVGAYGAIRELEVDGELTVDSGQVVAFESSLEFKSTKAGGSWIKSFLAGEGIVLRFTGKGRILVQSHSAPELGRKLGPKLPQRG